MKSTRWIQILFGMGALYDGLLGAGFLLAGPALFGKFGKIDDQDQRFSAVLEHADAIAAVF